jgi:hypothetical protein
MAEISAAEGGVADGEGNNETVGASGAAAATAFAAGAVAANTAAGHKHHTIGDDRAACASTGAGQGTGPSSSSTAFSATDRWQADVEARHCTATADG